MAVVRKQLAYMDDGALIVAFDYDDVDLRIISIHVENNSARTYVVSATAVGTGRNYTLEIAPGTIDQSIPAGAANRLGLSVTPSGKLDGVEWSIS